MTWAPQTIDELGKAHEVTLEGGVRGALERCDWNLSRAAESFGVSVSTMRKLMLQFPDLDDERKVRGPGPGRPTKAQG